MLAYDNIFSAIAQSDAQNIKNILNNSEKESLKPFLVNFTAVKRKSKIEENRVCVLMNIIYL